jgi:hypothetical protein
MQSGLTVLSSDGQWLGVQRGWEMALKDCSLSAKVIIGIDAQDSLKILRLAGRVFNSMFVRMGRFYL